MFQFEPFPKIARFKRELVISEKLDGTNAQVTIVELNSGMELKTAFEDPYCINMWDGPNMGDSAIAMYAGSRKRWIAPEGTSGLPKGCDNFAFAAWVRDNSNDLKQLGPGQHFGEWYGKGIQRGYGLEEKRFALFNTARWGVANLSTPDCCDVVPELNDMVRESTGRNPTPDVTMAFLNRYGSQASPGFMEPEGIVIYHSASRTLYKQTFEQDGGKWNSNNFCEATINSEENSQ